ncbi:MAG: MFS transporter [Epsilonproteobacteria bacterium]|nr:MFS transporter [Campylobacterota bacterium]
MNKKFNKTEVLTISSAHFAHDIFSSFLAPLLPLIIEKLGLSLSLVAFLDIIRRLPALFNPLLGLMAERTNVKYFVILTPAITAISMSLLGVAPSYFVLILLLGIAGVSSALFHIPSPTMIKQSSGNETGRGMSYFMVGGELARTLGPILITSAVSWWGLEGSYKLMPIGIISSILLYIKFRNFSTHIKAKKIEKGDVKTILKKHKNLFYFLGSFMLFNSALKSSLSLYLPVYLVNNGNSLWYAGIALSILQFSGVVGVFFSGKFSDKRGRDKILLYSSLGSIIFMALFLYTHHIIILAILGVFIFAPAPVLMALVQDTNSPMPTFMHSIYMGINFGLSSISVLLIGFLGDRVGLNETFIICNILGLGTLISVLFLLKERK